MRSVNPSQKSLGYLSGAPRVSTRPKGNLYNFLLYSHLQKLGVAVLDPGDVLRSPRQVWHLLWREADVQHPHWLEYVLVLPFLLQIPTGWESPGKGNVMSTGGKS